MDYQLSEQELALSGRLKVQYLDILKQALLEAVRQGGVVRVNFSQVRETDIAGLQLLLSWLIQTQPASMPRLVNLPQAMIQAIALGGLTSHFAPFME